MAEVQKIKTNICIIGAGPAGASASIFLCKMGIRHIIVDAATFPRDKVCGDGLDLNTIRILNHIDPAIFENEMAGNKENFIASAGYRFILPGGRQVYVVRNTANNSFANRPIAFVSKRFDFDNLLLSRIDGTIASVHLATRVNKITRQGKTWMLEGKGQQVK